MGDIHRCIVLLTAWDLLVHIQYLPICISIVCLQETLDGSTNENGGPITEVTLVLT